MKKVLLVTDHGVRAEGWMEAVARSLAEAEVPFAIFDWVCETPRAHEVMAGMEVYQSEECNGIVAVGGGSPMDCAKGIGITSSSMRGILAFEGVDRVSMPPPPLICIPTTAGSSADVSQFAVIKDEAGKRKIVIIRKALIPDISLLDPEPLTTMSRDLTIDTGMDALSHAVEAYASNGSSPMTDMHALEAIRLVHSALPAVVEDPGNLELRFLSLLASLHAGLAFSNASLGATHAMAHGVEGIYDITHGRCNALLLEHVVAANYDAAPERYDRIGAIFGTVTAEQISPAEKIAVFRRSLGITETLASAGVREDALPTLVQRAYADPDMATNPRNLTCEEVQQIYDNEL